MVYISELPQSEQLRLIIAEFRKLEKEGFTLEEISEALEIFRCSKISDIN